MTLPALVLLSDKDTDAPNLPAVCTVSKTDTWDHGAFSIGAADAVGGSVWIDRPYFTGVPSLAWIDQQIKRVSDAGGLCQVGNEPNLPLEGWRGGAETYRELYRLAEADRTLYAPLSPGVPGWQGWVGKADRYAVHAYGSFEQMRDVVRWYLEHTTGDLYVTECNPGAGNHFDLALWALTDLRPFLDWCATEPRVKVVAYFAYRWDQSPKLPSSVDAAGCAPLLNLLSTWKPPAPVTPEQPHKTPQVSPIDSKPNPIAKEPPMPWQPLRVALSAGHHNTGGGDDREVAMTGRLCAALARACRARGFDVRVVQDQDGLGMFPGSVGDVGRRVTAWDRGGWPVDFFLEMHGQALGDPKARGQFVVYPDWGDDVDADVRDRLGPDLARRLAVATGVPVWDDGTLSEKRSAVGLGGDRLGVFGQTVTLKDHCTRLIVESATFTNPADAALVARPEWPGLAAGAIADALLAFTGRPVPADDGRVRAALDAIWQQTTDLAGAGHTREAVVIQKHVGAAKVELGMR